MDWKDWATFVSKRLAALVVLFVVLSFVTFALMYVSPGTVVDVLLAGRPRSAATVHALNVEYHLDKPFMVQYWMWVRDALRFNFGSSIQTTLPVTDEIKARLPTSLLLGVYAYVLTMVSGIGLGVLAAFRNKRAVDRVVVAGTVVGLSMPSFVAGVFLLFVFAVQLPWFPAFGKGDGGLDTLWHLTLPAVALAMTSAAYVLKHTRAAVLGVLQQDYVVFARARGLSNGRVIRVYVLRNALIPILTISGVLFSYLIVGGVLVEMTFSIQGIGQLLVQSATAKDLPMLQGVVLLVSAVIILVNLLTDVVYLIADPRLRLKHG
ncbi:MAG: Peptide/nickel transport system permease protein [Marmoricola sp.]|jgi:peptide/nickel transport system permease protein|nr:Peptide/nickel transport system permease protein [Marmoricola sp.]